MKGSPSKAGNAEAERRALVVLGMHRSGTSAMTRMLSLLGAALPKGLMPAVPGNNETGFWEPMSIAALNDEILEALDSEWDDVFSFRPREYLSNFDRFYLGKARELLEQEFNGAELIVLKDPRVSVLTNFWDRALREAGFASSYVAMVRNPLEIAESLRSRDSFPREKSLLLWSSYMLALERDTRERQRIFISYDELIGDWRATRRRIEHAIGIPFPRDTAAAANEIDRFLDSRLRHHKSGAAALFDNPDVPGHIKTLYRLFLEACAGGEIDHAAIGKVYAELCEIEDLIGPIDAAWRAKTRELQRQLDEKRGVEEQFASAIASKEGIEAGFALLSTEKEALEEALALSAARTELLEAELAAATGQRDALDAELSAASGRADALERQLAQTNSDHQAQAAELAASLAAAKAERDRAVEEADLKVRHAEEQTQRKIAHVAEQWRSAEASLTAAKADLQSLAERLSHSDDELQRSRDEISSLNGAVREHEDRAERKQADLEWLRLVHEVMENSNAGWRRLLPRKWRRKRQLDLLRRRGLFDSAAYLDRYPDVQQAGLDPLYHYLAHGMDEGRAAEIRDDSAEGSRAAIRRVS